MLGSLTGLRTAARRSLVVLLGGLFSSWASSGCTGSGEGERAGVDAAPPPREPSSLVVAPPGPGGQPEVPSKSSPARPTITAPASPRTICEVRWSPDGSSVAVVDERHVRVRDRRAAKWSTEIEAPERVRFIDVSLAARAILQEGADGRRRLVSLDDGRSLFPEVVNKAPWARLSDDGTRLLAAESDPDLEPVGKPGFFVPWFLDLASGRQHEVAALPSVSEGGGPALIERYRRNAIQLVGSRIVVGFVDIRRARSSEVDEASGLVVVRDGIRGGYDTADCLAADVDMELRTVVVAKVDRGDRRRGRVDVYTHLLRSTWEAKATAGWPIDVDSFRGLWLSPDGRRVILRSGRGRDVRNGVWSTATGRRLGDIPLRGECFDFSPDGGVVADKRGRDLVLTALP